MSKKAQGLSFNMIVLAIIALLILVLIVAWATGAFGFLFGQTKTLAGVTDADITVAQSKCSKYCLQAQAITSADEWINTSYCKTVVIKTPEKEIRCWQEPVNQFCEVSVDDKTCTQDECQTGC